MIAMATVDADRGQRPPENPKRTQIREAAAALFLEQGFTRTSVDAISTTANVSKATVYAHYSDKDAILADVIQYLVGHVYTFDLPETDNDESITSIADLGSRLVYLCNAIVVAAMESNHLRLLRVVIAEGPHHPAIAEIFRDLAPGRALAAVGSMLSRAAGAGLIDSAQIDVLSRVLVGDMLSWILFDGLLAPGTPEPPSRSRIAQSVDLVLGAADRS